MWSLSRRETVYMPRKPTGKPTGRRRKQPSDYPPIFKATLLKLLEDAHQTYKIECSTPKHLAAMRFQAFSYFAALREHRDDDQEAMLLVELANNTWIRVEPPCLLFERHPLGSYETARGIAAGMGMVFKQDSDVPGIDRPMTPAEYSELMTRNMKRE